MAFFKKNPNEVLYPTGEKTIITVIKNESAPGNIIWKVPYEDFNTGSKVIVGENEEALFIKNGEILESFTGGEYNLNTNNYPFLSRIRNNLSGGISVYNCKIVYIMKAHNLDTRWGTDSPVQVIDKEYQIATNVVSRGAYTIQINDGKKFYLKFVKSNQDSLSAVDVANALRAPVNQKVKTTLGKVINSMEGEIIGICAQQEEIAENMFSQLEPTFDEYGVRLVNFYVEAVEVADDESRRKLEAARAERISMVIKTQGEKARLDTLGITWAQSESASILHDAAQNESNVPLGAGMGMGMGLGMGAGMGTAFSSMAANTIVPLGNGQQAGEPLIKPPQPGQQSVNRFAVKNDEASADTITCECGNVVPASSKFCPECGKRMSLFCSECGKPLTLGTKFCPECGKKVEQ